MAILVDFTCYPSQRHGRSTGAQVLQQYTHHLLTEELLATHVGQLMRPVSPHFNRYEHGATKLKGKFCVAAFRTCGHNDGTSPRL